ncbi:MAG: hypothetical protein MJE66_18485, partial [Proteobacteria bacterium]|nr:hypothetical protein [Pseudomonadota bacterium]
MERGASHTRARRAAVCAARCLALGSLLATTGIAAAAESRVPSNPAALLRDAVAADAAGDRKRADRLFNRVVTDYPIVADHAALANARAWLAAGDPAEA